MSVSVGAVVDLEVARRGVSEGGPVHRDVIQRQRHVTLDRHPAIVQNGVDRGEDVLIVGRGAVDSAIAIDVDGAAAPSAVPSLMVPPLMATLP